MFSLLDMGTSIPVFSSETRRLKTKRSCQQSKLSLLKGQYSSRTQCIQLTTFNIYKVEKKGIIKSEYGYISLNKYKQNNTFLTSFHKQNTQNLALFKAAVRRFSLKLSR